MNRFRQVKNLPVIHDMLGEPQGFIRNFRNLEVDRVLNAEKYLTMQVDGVLKYHIEQEIIFRDERYIVTELNEEKDNLGRVYTELEAVSSFVELADKYKPGRFTLVTVTLSDAVSAIVDDTGWLVGDVEEELQGVLVSIDQENPNTLELLNLLRKLANCEIEYNTIGRRVSLKERIGVDLEDVVRYRKNMKEISRKTEPPRATVMYPTGRDGLSIASVNGGYESIENFSYYTDVLGIPLQVARQKFRKDYIYSDERFIYAKNLKTFAESEIARLSQPIVSYQTTVSMVNFKTVLEGDYLYVLDEELDIKKQARVVRLVDKVFRENENEIGLNHLEEELGTMQSDEVQGSSDTGKVQIVIGENEDEVEITDFPTNLIEMAVSIYASSNLKAFLEINTYSTEKTLLEFYIEVDGVVLTREYKHTLGEDSFEVVTVNTPLLQIEEGSKNINLVVKADKTGVVIEKRGSRLVIEGTTILGGEKAELPKANVTEPVDYEEIFSLVDEVVTVDLQEEGEGNE